MSDLFHMTAELPEAPGRLPMFRATTSISMSSRDEPHRAALERRTRSAMRAFGPEGEPVDEGERMVVRDGARVLQVYRASDSVWWADFDRAYPDTPSEPARLPSEGEAVERSRGVIEEAKLDARDAAAVTTAFVTASVAEAADEPRTARVALDVSYAFALAERPVFGPGAKIKVTFADGGEVAQVLYFWRRPRRAAAMAAISPDEALARFRRDPAFYRLRKTDAAIEVRRVQLGYYALPPGDFQRLYIPVYAIDATVRTRDLPVYDLRRHVVAVDVAPERAKELDAVANPAACRMF